MLKLLRENRTVTQFLVVTLLITVAAAVAAGIILNRRSKDHLILTHIKVYPVMVAKIMERYPDVVDGMRSGSLAGREAQAAAVLEEFRSFGSVFRIKLWGPDGTVVWSDSPSIVGKRFDDNAQFQQSRTGMLTYAVAKPLKAEHETEQTTGSILEIYVPVYRNEEVAGILELYERDERLYEEISGHATSVWVIIGSFGGVLFLTMFAVFYRADASLNQAVRKVEQTQQVTIMALAYQAELRDADTGRHIERTSHYVRILTEEIRRSRRYPGYMGGTYVDDIVRSAPLHDIGKVAIPDAILRKPGRLDPDEQAEIRKHCTYGVSVLDEAHAQLPFQTFLELARQLILHHHERWDGNGYPIGLKGENIPLSGRIMAVADVYDALRCKRPYKEPFPHERCVEIIAEESGKQFDPAIVKVFLAVEQEFRAISESLGERAT